MSGSPHLLQSSSPSSFLLFALVPSSFDTACSRAGKDTKSRSSPTTPLFPKASSTRRLVTISRTSRWDSRIPEWGSRRLQTFTHRECSPNFMTTRPGELRIFRPQRCNLMFLLFSKVHADEGRVERPRPVRFPRRRNLARGPSSRTKVQA